ncbi:hypothetical protein [Streptomyces sp. NPDC088726]|uniref:hypothetical protein n=1 Tax=Streptomyces sp. NPDC088726 TaxID=3365874 RepID=UPI003806334B
MSTEQHDASAYGQELAAISQHQHEATNARFTVFQALAAAGIGHEQADDIVAERQSERWHETRTRDITATVFAAPEHDRVDLLTAAFQRGSTKLSGAKVSLGAAGGTGQPLTQVPTPTVELLGIDLLSRGEARHRRQELL